MGIVLKRLKGLIIFSYIFSSIGTLNVAYIDASNDFMVSLLSIILTLPIVYVLYKAIEISSSEGGLYDHIKLFFNKLSTLFLLFWVFSYFLYLTYTIYFITYYTLPLSGVEFISLTLLLIGGIALISWLNLEVYSLIPISLLQIIFLIPFFWHVKPITTSIQFSPILSQALLPICVTLVPFLGKELKGNSNMLLTVYAIASAFIISDSLFRPTQLVYYATSLTSLGLILAEFFSLKNILSYNVKKTPLILAFIIVALIGLLNPEDYYNYLISVSLPSLYVSLSIYFFSSFIFFRNIIMKLLSLFSLGLMLYGLYTSLIPHYLLLQGPTLVGLGLFSVVVTRFGVSPKSRQSPS